MLISNCTIDWKEHVFNVSMSHLILRMCVCVRVRERGTEREPFRTMPMSLCEVWKFGMGLRVT